MTMLLDGEKVRGKGLKVSAMLRIETGDLSGQTSNTDAAHKGFKPKSLVVTLLIPFNDRSHLVQLMSWAQATGTGGQRHTYRIVNDTAEAFGVRQVEFSDGVSAREDDTLSAWRIQFTLTEKLSTAERVEKRRSSSSVTQQSASGQSVDGSGTGGSTSSSSSTELTGFERVLQKIDDALS